MNTIVALEHLESLLARSEGADAPLRIVSMEGNIGVGKSTLLAEWKRRYEHDPRIVFMPEPVDQWSKIRDAEGNTILSCFYSNPDKYAFPFQVLAYTSRLAAFQQVVESHPACEIIVCERSLEADRHIFAEMMRDQGTIEPMVYEVYRTLYDATAKPFEVDTILYLEATPETCLRRIQKRDRAGEGGIQLDYLEKCHAYYEQWIARLDKVIRIGCEADKEVSVPVHLY
jgi:deoxyadenosine/deoxycytidine kinase